MVQLLVQEYLINHNFQQLEEDHGVIARPSALGTKFSLNYDQILVKSGDLVAEQCRGAVIRPTQWNWAVFKDDWKSPMVGASELIAWPMNRFYNMGDHAGAAVNWSDPDLRVYTKLDGTMIVCYWDEQDNRWHAGTRGVCEADLPIRAGDINIGDITFSGLFFNALASTTGAPVEYALSHFNKQYTYVFELTSPHNRVVVKYNEASVTLLAVRDLKTGHELPIHEVMLPNVPLPTSWELHEPTALVAFVDQADPAELEGCVVIDSEFRRLKVKSKAWVLSSRAKDLVTVSRRGALEAIIHRGHHR